MSDNRDKIPDGMECPRQLFGHDLKALVESLQDKDHQIVLMGDWNSEYPLLEEWMLDLGLVNVLKERHGEIGPRTCIKSKNSPIDCVFASPQLKIRNAGSRKSTREKTGAFPFQFPSQINHIIIGINT